MSQDANPPDSPTLPLASAGYEPATPSAPPNLAGDLAQAIGFSPDVLPANRAGQMTDEQVATVQRKAAAALWPALLMAAIFAFFIVVRPTTLRNGRPIVWNSTTITVFVASSIVLVSLLLVGASRTWADAQSKQTLMAQGALTKSRTTGKRAAYLIRVNQLSFIVSKAGFDLLPDGLPCRVYYTPRSKIVLSAEPD